jgi:hypothetical protein
MPTGKPISNWQTKSYKQESHLILIHPNYIAMTFADWATYFSVNQTHLDNLSWDDTYRLTERELRAIRYSLPQFQQGENSEGRHLYQKAKDFGDPDYVAAIRLFIREEQGHARVLGQYMALHQLPRLCKSSALDKVFRWLRQWASLEHTLRVLLTAEIIAAVYYQALYQATYSGLLQQICRRILRCRNVSATMVLQVKLALGSGEEDRRARCGKRCFIDAVGLSTADNGLFEQYDCLRDGSRAD